VFTQIPNYLLDRILRLNGRKARILLAVIRLTLGYHRKEVEVSLNKLQKLTGIDRSDISKILRSLEGDGIISVSTRPTHVISIRLTNGSRNGFYYRGIPVGKITTLYNSILDSLTPIRYWNKRRLKALCERWYEDPSRQNLAFWEELFKEVRRSDFLMGKVKKWQCNIDWLLEEEHLIKVLEGAYRNRYSPADMLSAKTVRNWEVVRAFEEALDEFGKDSQHAAEGITSLEGRHGK